MPKKKVKIINATPSSEVLVPSLLNIENFFPIFIYRFSGIINAKATPANVAMNS